MVFRKPVESARGLDERIEHSRRLGDLMSELRELSATLKIDLDVVFQALLQGVGERTGGLIGKGGNFDQATYGRHDAVDFVPMHQAKVLDRSDRLGEQQAAIQKLAGERYDWLVDSADLLRKLLRVKVEDGNDLHMAATTVDEIHRFHTHLVQHAQDSGEGLYALYTRLVSF